MARDRRTRVAPVDETDARAAGRGAFNLLAVQLGTRATGVLFVLVAARSVNPSTFAHYSIASGAVVIGAFLADLGTSAAIARLVARGTKTCDDILRETTLGCFTIGLGSCLLIGLFGQLAYHGPTVTTVWVAAASLPASAVATSFFAALDGAGLIAIRSRLLGAQTAIVMVGGAASFYFFGSVVAAVSMFPLAAAIAVVAAALMLHRAGLWTLALRVGVAETLWLLRQGLPFAGLAGIAVVYRRFDVLLLSVVSGPGATAVYDTSLRVVEALGFLGSFVSAPALFLLNRRLAAGDAASAQRGLDRGARLVYLVALPVSVALVALHVPLVAALFGRNYVAAGLPLAILGGQFWLEMASALQGSVVASLPRLRPALKLSGALLLVIIALDLCLIPVLGAPGAAMATAIFQVINVLAVRRLTRREVSVVLPFPAWGIVVAALTSGAILVVGPDPHESLPLRLPAAMVAYVTVVAITRTVTVEDVRQARLLIGRGAS